MSDFSLEHWPWHVQSNTVRSHVLSNQALDHALPQPEKARAVDQSSYIVYENILQAVEPSSQQGEDGQAPRWSAAPLHPSASISARWLGCAQAQSSR